MYPARDLYTVVVPPADKIDGGVESGIVLIHGLTGFMDAGGGFGCDVMIWPHVHFRAVALKGWAHLVLYLEISQLE